MAKLSNRIFLAIILIVAILLFVAFAAPGFAAGAVVTANIGIAKVFRALPMDAQAQRLINWTKGFGAQADKAHGTSYIKEEGGILFQESTNTLWGVSQTDIQGWFGLKWRIDQQIRIPPPLPPLPPPLEE